MHWTFIVFFVMLYFAINSYFMISIVSSEDKWLVRLILFLFGLLIVMTAVIAAGIYSIIFYNETDQEG